MALLVALVVGCGQAERGGNAASRGVTVEISESQGFGRFHDDPFVTYEGGLVGSAAERIERAVLQAEKQPGIVNMVEPEYDVRFTYSDGSMRAYHLWLDERGEYATVMSVLDTHFIYEVSKNSVKDLIEIIGE
ncbi:hypothetical protein MO973_12645 [Paenibacillus sp. TRM 82003]|nr:hypothetical protein [Paenibacillus sp. TRM 82003]